MPPLKWVQHVSLVWSAGFVNLQEVWNKKLRKQLPDYSANKTPLRMFHVSQIRFGLQNKDLYFLCGVWANKGRLIILTVDVIYRLQSCAFPKEERKVSVDMLGNSSSVCRSTGRQWQFQLEPPPNQVVTLFNSKYFTNHLRGGNGFVSLLK